MQCLNRIGNKAAVALSEIIIWRCFQNFCPLLYIATIFFFFIFFATRSVYFFSQETRKENEQTYHFDMHYFQSKERGVHVCVWVFLYFFLDMRALETQNETNMRLSLSSIIFFILVCYVIIFRRYNPIVLNLNVNRIFVCFFSYFLL